MQKTYNTRIIKLIGEIQSVHAELFSFFNNVKNNSCINYEEEFEEKYGILILLN